MPTPLDRALDSKNLFLGFAGMVSAAAVWAIWGNDMFPTEPDPTGSKRTRELELQVDGKLTCEDPEDWTIEELRRWLRARGLLPSERSPRDELVERVKANLRASRASAQ